MGFAKRTAIVALGAALAALAAMLGAAGAWACLPGGGGNGKKLTVTPARVKPGEQVTVSAPLAAAASPIDLRLNAANGPLLGTLTSNQVTADGGAVRATFSVPLDTKPGQNALIAVQQGVKWDPVLLPVAAEDGSVPEVTHAGDAAAAPRSRGSARIPWVLGSAGSVVAGVAVAARFGARRGRNPNAHPAGPRVSALLTWDARRRETRQ